MCEPCTGLHGEEKSRFVDVFIYFIAGGEILIQSGGRKCSTRLAIVAYPCTGAIFIACCDRFVVSRQASAEPLSLDPNPQRPN